MTNPIQAIVEELIKLGCEDRLLDFPESDIPPPICRDSAWPETQFEIDPDKLISWLTSTLTTFEASIRAEYEKGNGSVEEIIEKFVHFRLNNLLLIPTAEETDWLEKTLTNLIALKDREREEAVKEARKRCAEIAADWFSKAPKYRTKKDLVAALADNIQLNETKG